MVVKVKDNPLFKTPPLGGVFVFIRATYRAQTFVLYFFNIFTRVRPA